ncbi:MAG: BrnT family toxin [Bdellovibrio sp.]|nr:BrnT family toxin [Bdellovibrio sp.]
MLKTIIIIGSFEWDSEKERVNIQKHGIDFLAARLAFKDPGRIFIFDELHSQFEARYFCLGRTSAGVLTVRFRMRGNRIRIYGAGRWRKWEKYYEKANQKSKNK